MCTIDWTALGTWVIAVISLISVLALRKQLKDASETINRQAQIDRERMKPVMFHPNSVPQAANGQLKLVLEWHYYQPKNVRAILKKEYQARFQVIEIKSQSGHSRNVVDAHPFGTFEIILGHNITTVVSLEFEMDIQYSDLFGSQYIQHTKFFMQRWTWNGDAVLAGAD